MLDPASAQDVSWAAHETGHAFGLNHSYDTALSGCTSSPIPGEYCDPYDQMGYENSGNTFQTSQFGNSAPGLTAPNLIKLAYAQPTVLDPHNGTEDVGLLPLEQSPSVLEVLAGDVAGHYYTVEYRDPSLGYASGTAWGQKLSGPGVVIHEVRTNGLSHLVDQQGGPSFGTCGVFVGAATSNGTVRILVDSLPSPWTGNEAFVRIGSVGDGTLDPGACSASGGAAVTGVGGGGGPAENCQYPTCGPRPLQCNFANGADNPLCGVCTSAARNSKKREMQKAHSTFGDRTGGDDLSRCARSWSGPLMDAAPSDTCRRCSVASASLAKPGKQSCHGFRLLSLPLVR